MVMAEPTASVVMPVFNGSRFLAEAIQSVLTQSFQDFELIVVDDGSTDNSAQIVRELMIDTPKIKLLQQHNKGVTVARNRGILASTSPYIAFIDQDDVWEREALQWHLAEHTGHPVLGYTLAHQICFLAENCQPPAWFSLQRDGVSQIGYLPGTLMAKRSLFSSLGLFDTQYAISSDADWFICARDAKIPMRILPQVVLKRRIHSYNQSSNSKEIQREIFRLLQASIKRKRNGDA